MQAQIGQGYVGKELIDFLSANDSGREEMTFIRYFDKTESEELLRELGTVTAELGDIKDEMAEEAEKYKEKMKPKTKRQNEIRQELKWNGNKVKETVYKMVDEEQRMVGWYDRSGKLVNSRPFTPEDYDLFNQNLRLAS